MKRTRLNPMSLKKIEQLNAEVPDRIALCQRAGGTPIKGKHTYYIRGRAYPITTVQCYGGVCECGCQTQVDGMLLHPHEKVFRSKGGHLSLGNSLMLLNEHHAILQNNEPHWTKPSQPCLGNMVR